jgi:hypothetical protein
MGRTLNELRDDMETFGADVLGEYGKLLWSRGCVLRVMDRGELESGGDWILVCQLSTSPVACELTIDDDSNGSIARDRFNLIVSR